MTDSVVKYFRTLLQISTTWSTMSSSDKLKQPPYEIESTLRALLSSSRFIISIHIENMCVRTKEMNGDFSLYD